MGRIKSNAVDRLPNNKHPNMKTSTFFALAASCALLASGASAQSPYADTQYAPYDDGGNDFYGDAPGGYDDVYDVMVEVIPDYDPFGDSAGGGYDAVPDVMADAIPDYDPNAYENRDDFFDDDVGCPWDIKYCPSGTSVVRSGPDCAFEVCPEDNDDDDENSDDYVVCPTDVKICPSGASVTRSGPDCAFEACPGDNDDDESHHDPCKCRDSCEYVNDYHICYVRDPHACHDAFPSRYYEDEKWIWCPWEEEKHDDWKPPSKKKHHDWDWHDWKKHKKHIDSDRLGAAGKKKSYKNWFKKSGGKFGRGSRCLSHRGGKFALSWLGAACSSFSI